MKNIFILCLGLLLPVVTYAQRKTITWEKEGIETYHKIMALSEEEEEKGHEPTQKEKDKKKSDSTFSVKDQCSLLYVISLMDIDNIIPLIQKMKKDSLVVLGISSLFFFGAIASSIDEIHDPQIECFQQKCIHSGLLSPQ